MTRITALAISAVALLVGVVSTPLHAQSALDGFNPGANGLGVLAIAEAPDGKILVVGGFTTLGGGGTGTTSRNRIGRLHADGSLDLSFDPGANANVNAVVRQPDGKILVGGEFTMLGGGGTGATARNHLGRLNDDGSLDTSFNPGSNGRIVALALQPDGKILVAGFFTGLGGGTGTTPRANIGRLNADGSVDVSFNPGANGQVGGLALQADGKILVGGAFTMLGGGGTGVTARSRIGRLNADGSLDTGFNPGANNTVFELAVQADGKIVVTGFFTGLGGSSGTTPRKNIGRFNNDGSLDSGFDPGANGTVGALAVRADGKILVGGTFTALGGGIGTTPRNNIGRLNADGSVDPSFNPGTTGTGDVFAIVQQADGQILVGGFFTGLGGGTGTTPRSHIGRLHADGTVDVDFNPGVNNFVDVITLQPDGKILVAGAFTTLGGGGTGVTARSYIGRLNPEGSLDATFNPGANSFVLSVAVQPDGKILVGGTFTALGGGTGTTARNFIGRLNPDGSLDPTFNPGANGNVLTLALQSDGKILVGGDFTTLGGSARSNIGRLNPDGSLDTTFTPGASGGVLDGAVWALLVQPDGKILVGGDFTLLGGGGTGSTPRNFIGRLNSDGTIDAEFNPGANSFIQSFALQPDGKIVVGGGFTTLGGGGTGMTPRSRIGRLNPDGSLDASFDPGANSSVYALAMQADGKIVVGGDFTTLGGGGTGTIPRNRIARLNPDASTDTAFNPGANAHVLTLTVQPDGKILASGPFTTLGGGGIGATTRNGIGRLTNTNGAFERLSASCPGCVSGAVQAQVTWARSGAGPEVDRVTIEASSDGVTYGPTASATRVPGGWQAFQDVSSNVNRFIRARGYYAPGRGNKSGSIVESIRQVYVACPAVAPSSLPVGTAGLPYSATFTAPGAIGVVTFGVTGPLPAGLALSSTGTLSGTPTQAGTFLITVTATDQSSGCTGSQAVTFLISPTAPLLTLDKTALRFAAVTTGAAFVSQTAAQVVRLTQSGAGTVTWTAVPSQPWLQVSPASGHGSADLSIGVVVVPGLPVGSPVAGAITLTVTGASNTPGPITVVLDLLLNELSAPPFGVVDTPLENTTGVTGAVPFTGWALDDVEVTRVMVCRAAFGAEVAPVDPNCGGAAQIFVGFAVFVDGARPDVAAFYPTYPVNTRAGWGFMVLTNTLPSQGNGTYLFYLHAQDRDGHTTLLGTRTLTCANASATKPFGAIDTPSQGGVASGNGYAVYGWVLSRLAHADPPGGGTVTVQVNGVTVGSPGLWAARPDLTAAFPGYPGIDSALGVYGLNTLAYPNGVHTIQWTVTDSLGVTEGIGSRFFTVSNGAGAITTAVEGASRRGGCVEAAAPHDDAPVLGRRGWDLERPWRWYGVGREGRVVIRGEEIDRFELRLRAEGGAHYTGHLRVGEELAALPAGSQLDGATGLFTWAPGVGFVGPYDLVFVRWVGGHAVARHEVRVILAPKGSGSVGPQIVIDAPRSQQDVAQPFALGGWAADLNATTGTGIATVHAWAYPLAGGPPVFLGAASYGGARPDVAAVHGEAFRDSGFGLIVQGLAPGNYDLAVFAWSTEAADFVPAKVVRVTVR